MYPDGEALILTTLQGVTGFSTTNTARGKWGLLNKGTSDHYGILKPGEFNRAQITMTGNESLFNTIIQIWQRYKDDGDSLTTLEGHVKNVIVYFDNRPHLGGGEGQGIYEGMIIRGREVEERWTRGGGVSWLKQDLILEWKEIDNATYAE